MPGESVKDIAANDSYLQRRDELLISCRTGAIAVHDLHYESEPMEPNVLEINASDAQPALMATLWLLSEFLRHGAWACRSKCATTLLPWHRILRPRANRAFTASAYAWLGRATSTVQHVPAPPRHPNLRTLLPP